MTRSVEMTQQTDSQRTVWVMRPVDDDQVVWVFSNEESARAAEHLAQSMYRSVTLAEFPVMTITGAQL